MAGHGAEPRAVTIGKSLCKFSGVDESAAIGVNTLKPGLDLRIHSSASISRGRSSSSHGSSKSLLLAPTWGCKMTGAAGVVGEGRGISTVAVAFIIREDDLRVPVVPVLRGDEALLAQQGFVISCACITEVNPVPTTNQGIAEGIRVEASLSIQVHHHFHSTTTETGCFLSTSGPDK